MGRLGSSDQISTSLRISDSFSALIPRELSKEIDSFTDLKEFNKTVYASLTGMLRTLFLLNCDGSDNSAARTRFVIVNITL